MQPVLSPFLLKDGRSYQPMQNLQQRRLKVSFIALANWERKGKINSFLNSVDNTIIKWAKHVLR
jgi:hypothetical protein